jgi:2-polyprenyl-3-methyl-5-hydroxy-6-metoxy-1,4-benzoquinol methylase
MIASACQYCVVCGGERCLDYLWTVRGHEVGKCRLCGTGASWSMPQDIREIYSKDYFDGKRADGYADYSGSEPVLRREFRKLVAQLFASVPPGGKLLEPGCAYGFFLETAKGTYRVSGIEICADAIRFCQRRGLDVCHGELTYDYLKARGPFDCAVMLDVIEHLERPDNILSLLSSAMVPGGTLLITTGDFETVPSRLMKQSWRLMTPPQAASFLFAIEAPIHG